MGVADRNIKFQVKYFSYYRVNRLEPISVVISVKQL